MFNHLIESQPHRNEIKRRGWFFLATTVAYAVLFFAAGIAGIYAYDARLESQSPDLALLSWVPPISPSIEPAQLARRAYAAASNSRRIAPQSVRPIILESPRDPRQAGPVSANPNLIPPAPRNAAQGSNVADPPASIGSTVCHTCPGNEDAINAQVHETPPPTRPVVPKTQTLPPSVLVSRAISLPKPAYPPIAKQSGAQGLVNVQILVDENGKVIAAHAVSGHPTLIYAAVQAAYQARFTPTLYNGQPIKVQGVITYNFVLQ